MLFFLRPAPRLIRIVWIHIISPIIVLFLRTQASTIPIEFLLYLYPSPIAQPFRQWLAEKRGRSICFFCPKYSRSSFLFCLFFFTIALLLCYVSVPIVTHIAFVFLFFYIDLTFAPRILEARHDICNMETEIEGALRLPGENKNHAGGDISTLYHPRRKI